MFLLAVVTMCRICVIDDLRLIIFLHVIAPRPVMCSLMLICQCCFAIVKVLLKKVTYLLTYLWNSWQQVAPAYMFGCCHLHFAASGLALFAGFHKMLTIRSS